MSCISVVLVGGSPTAVLCCEHCGERKAWSDADLDHLQQVASVLGMAFKDLAA